MVSTLTVIAACLLVVCASALIWRGTRRVLASDGLKDISVSREWLVQHQSDED